MTIKDLAVQKPYYASETCYYDGNTHLEYPTWSEYLEEWADADIDYNLIFRWDVTHHEEKDRYYMQIFRVGQRKGTYQSQTVLVVTDDDVESIISYLQPYHKTIQDIWKPL